MRRVKQCLSGIIAILLLIASIPLNVFAAGEIAITTQPVNITAAEGQRITMSVEATGDGLSYQWQYKKPTGTSWINFNGATGSSCKKTMVNTWDGWKYRCVITDTHGNSITTEEATITLINGPQITVQPVNISAFEGQRITMSVVATGEGLNYQWQYKKSTGTSWTNFNGATSASCTKSMVSTWDGWKYRCVITDAEGNSITTEEAMITLINGPRITVQPVNITAFEGQRITMSVVATGDGLSYQWQYKKPTGTSWINFNGATSASCTKSMVNTWDGWKYRCVITDTDGNSIATEEATITLINGPKIIVQPENITAVDGQRITMSVEATGDGLIYQWQYKKTVSSAWVNFSGATNPLCSKTMKETWDGWKYRCLITDENGNSITTDEATITLATSYTITYDAGNGTFPDGSSFVTNNVQPGNYYLQAKDANGGDIWPGRGGYSFVGWMYKDRLSRNIKVTSDATVYAVWEQNYAIKYNANGGTFTDDSIEFASDLGLTCQSSLVTDYVTKGSYRIPDWLTVEKEGFVFKGWKLGNSYLTDVVVDGSANAYELFADWAPAAKITYNANGGYWLFDATEGPFTTVDDYEEYGIYTLGWHEPVRPGYKFLGWKVNNRNVKTVNLTGDITAYAMWRELYKVKYDANGGVWSTDEYSWLDGDTDIYVEETNPGHYGVGSNVPNPHREGYEFFGWSAVSNAPRGEWVYEVNLQGNMTVYATWVKSNLTVTYDANGGWMEIDGVSYETFIQDNDPWDWNGIELFPWAEKGKPDEYKFLGWSENPNATEPTYEHRQRLHLDRSLVLYAVYEKRVAITFDGNGGTWPKYEEGHDGDENFIIGSYGIRTEYRDKGEYWYPRTWHPEYDDDDYRFDGWLDEDNNLLDDSEVIVLDEDLELTAKWVKRIYITYNANGGCWGDDANDTQRVNECEEGTDVHIGYEWPNNGEASFVGWSTKSNAIIGVDNIVPDQDIELHTNATYYAIWSTPFKVKYNANGGVFYHDDFGNPVTIQEDTDVHYCSNNDYRVRDRVDRDGYRFLGWSTNPAATVATYEPGEWIPISGPTTFYAVWQKYPWVTYHANGGEWGEGQDAEDTRIHWGNENEYYYVGMEAPNRENYEFDGWVDSTGADAEHREIILDKDYDFYAKWLKRITITYNANQGIFSSGRTEGTDNCKEGMVGIEYEWPQRGDYTFVGWSTNQNAVPGVDEIETNFNAELHANTTYYAIWSDTFDVTFDGNGAIFGYDGNNDPIITETWKDIRYGEINLKGWVDREGYRFCGWSEDPLGVSKPVYHDGERIKIKKATTFYAIWDKQAWVTYHANGGEWGEDETERLDWRNPGEYYYVGYERPGRENYEFAGWADSPDAAFANADNRLITLDEDYDFYATWKTMIPVTYYANGGEFRDYGMPSGDQEYTGRKVETRTTKTGEEHWFIDWEPERDGYWFLGWSYDEDGTEEDIIPNPINVPLNCEEITLYAVWGKRCIVTFEFQGGSWNEFNDEFSYEQDPMTPFFVGYIEPHKDGYEFLGWNEDPTATTAEPNYYIEALTDDITFYAVWKPLVTVTFDAGENGHIENEQTKSVYFRNGETFNFTQVWNRDGEVFEPRKEGYIFAGWLYNGQAFNNISLTENITLTASWVEEHTIFLDANGGALWYDKDGTPVSCISLTKDADSFIYAYDYEPSRYGYEFDGWYEGDTLVNKFTFTADHAFVAHWTPIEEYEPEPDHTWGNDPVTEVVITSSKTAVLIDEEFQLNYSVIGEATSYSFYISTDGENWTLLTDEGEYGATTSLSVPGDYYYKLIVDGVESSPICVTVVPNPTEW